MITMNKNNPENLVIVGNQHCPYINFDRQNGNLNIAGRSILENSIAFFEPVIKWLDLYILQPAPITTFNIKLDYFNTSTSKYILMIIEYLEELHKGGNIVQVNWYYNDEDMQELGEDYKNIVNVPFELIPFLGN